MCKEPDDGFREAFEKCFRDAMKTSYVSGVNIAEYNAAKNAIVSIKSIVERSLVNNDDSVDDVQYILKYTTPWKDCIGFWVILPDTGFHLKKRELEAIAASLPESARMSLYSRKDGRPMLVFGFRDLRHVEFAPGI